jgi:hypothetical protein
MTAAGLMLIIVRRANQQALIDSTAQGAAQAMGWQ